MLLIRGSKNSNIMHRMHDTLEIKDTFNLNA